MLSYHILLGLGNICVSFVISVNCSTSLLFLIKIFIFIGLILQMLAKLNYFLIIHIRVGFIREWINCLNWLCLKRTILLLIKLIIGGFRHHRTSVIPTGTTDSSMLDTFHHLWYIRIELALCTHKSLFHFLFMSSFFQLVSFHTVKHSLTIILISVPFDDIKCWMLCL